MGSRIAAGALLVIVLVTVLYLAPVLAKLPH
jgi:hypothetical protein